jgi:hypothetical protein
MLIAYANNLFAPHLPSVCFSGIFNGERKDELIVSHSGFIVLEFDDVDDVETLKHELIAKEFIKATWVSPSGNGVKALVLEVLEVLEVALHPFKYLSIEFNSPIIFSKIVFTKVIVVVIDDIVFCALVILGVILANVLFNESKETKSAFPGSGEPGVGDGIKGILAFVIVETVLTVFTTVEVTVTTVFKGSTIFFN